MSRSGLVQVLGCKGRYRLYAGIGFLPKNKYMISIIKVAKNLDPMVVLE